MTLNAEIVRGAPGLHRFRSDDLDEAVDHVRRYFGDHSRVPRSRGPLGYELVSALAPRSFAAWHTLAIPTTVRATARGVMVHLVDAEAEYRIGRRTLRASPGVAVLLVPGIDYTVRTTGGTARGLGLDASLLAAELAGHWAARGGSWSLRCMELPLTSSESAELRSLCEQHLAAVGAVPSRSDDPRLDAVQHQMASWLAARIAGTAGLAPLSRSSRSVADKVEAWIRAHIAHPITLDELKTVTGVSGRTLQKACLARWGQSPLELVASRRLQAVRDLLATGAPGLTVTDAAVRCGFAHLGRFAALYKQSFGEAPSDTLCGRRRAA